MNDFFASPIDMSEFSMKFSIVTAVYNRERTIGDAIRCLQQQSFGDYEHIIIDGASTDNTVAEVERLADQRLRLVSEPDAGIYDAINKGVAMARGEIIGLLHSDDTFAHARVLETVAERFERDHCLMAYGDLDYVSKDNGRTVRRWRAGPYRYPLLRRGWMPPHPTVFAVRSIFDELGAYDVSYRIGADYEAMLRYFLMHGQQAAYIPETLVLMRTGGASNHSLRALLRKMGEDYRSMRRHGVGGWPTVLWKNISKIIQFR